MRDGPTWGAASNSHPYHCRCDQAARERVLGEDAEERSKSGRAAPFQIDRRAMTDVTASNERVTDGQRIQHAANDAKRWDDDD